MRISLHQPKLVWNQTGMGLNSSIARIAIPSTLQYLCLQTLEENFYQIDIKAKISNFGEVNKFNILFLQITSNAIYGHLIYEGSEVE